MSILPYREAFTSSGCLFNIVHVVVGVMQQYSSCFHFRVLIYFDSLYWVKPRIPPQDFDMFSVGLSENFTTMVGSSSKQSSSIYEYIVKVISTYILFHSITFYDIIMLWLWHIHEQYMFSTVYGIWYHMGILHKKRVSSTIYVDFSSHINVVSKKTFIITRHYV